MTRIRILSHHILSPLGSGSQENWDAVMAGQCAMRLHPGTREAFYASLLDRERLPAMPGYSYFESLCIRSIREALRGSGVDPAAPDTAFVLSSIKGDIEALGTVRDVTLPHAAARIAAYFGQQGPVLTVSNACISGLNALIQGRRMLLSGRYRHVIVCGAECQSPFIVTGFQSLKALSPEPCRPFDARRCGLNLGEAAATVILGTGDGGWELAEGAVRNDANHISGPSRTGEGSYHALRYVLRDVSPADLALVSVHGTATLYNDEMEAVALGRAGLEKVPLSGLKGWFGHTMGAAGILESILAMLSVERGVMPGTRGFQELGVSVPVTVSADPVPVQGTAFVKLLSGFGGCNAAALFRKGGVR